MFSIYSKLGSISSGHYAILSNKVPSCDVRNNSFWNDNFLHLSILPGMVGSCIWRKIKENWSNKVSAIFWQMQYICLHHEAISSHNGSHCIICYENAAKTAHLMPFLASGILDGRNPSNCLSAGIKHKNLFSIMAIKK